MNVTLFKLTVLHLITVFSQPAHACSCAPSSNDFFETVFLHNQKVQSGEWPSNQPLTIVIAQVKEYKQLRPGPRPTEMVLQVTGILQGNLTKKELIVEGDDGIQCRPYVTEFPVGKKFVFALNRDNGILYISGCGIYAREIKQPY